ncbi:ABC transporter ATP-binding protein, partial [Streptomyces sp. NPDC041003]
TVFLSSHLMSEMQLTADRLVVIGRGRLLADTPMADFLAAGASASVRVRTADPGDLDSLARHLGAYDEVSVESQGGEPNEIVVRGRTAAEIGDLAHRLGVRLHQLHSVPVSLEQAYMELTEHSVEYGTAARARPQVSAGPVPTATTEV